MIGNERVYGELQYGRQSESLAEGVECEVGPGAEAGTVRESTRDECKPASVQMGKQRGRGLGKHSQEP